MILKDRTKNPIFPESSTNAVKKAWNVSPISDEPEVPSLSHRTKDLCRHPIRHQEIARCHLHRGTFINPLANGTSAKEKAIGTACSTVLGLIPGTEKPEKILISNHHPS